MEQGWRAVVRSYGGQEEPPERISEFAEQWPPYIVWDVLVLLCHQGEERAVLEMCQSRTEWVCAYALMAAATPALRTLLAEEYGAKVRFDGPNATIPICYAISRLDETLLDHLLELGVCVTHTALSTSRMSPLISLVLNHELVTPWGVQRMLELGASPLDDRVMGELARTGTVDSILSAFVMLEHARTRYWTRRTHHEYPKEFCERVFALLCVNARTRILHRNVVDIVVQHMCASLWDAPPPGARLGETPIEWDAPPPGARLVCKHTASGLTMTRPLYGHVILIGGPPWPLRVLPTVCVQYIDVTPIAKDGLQVCPRLYVLVYQNTYKRTWMLNVSGNDTMVSNGPDSMARVPPSSTSYRLCAQAESGDWPFIDMDAGIVYSIKK